LCNFKRVIYGLYGVLTYSRHTTFTTFTFTTRVDVRHLAILCVALRCVALWCRMWKPIYVLTCSTWTTNDHNRAVYVASKVGRWMCSRLRQIERERERERETN